MENSVPALSRLSFPQPREESDVILVDIQEGWAGLEGELAEGTLPSHHLSDAGVGASSHFAQCLLQQ